MAEACPIASPNAGELRYIERSAWAGVSLGNAALAEEVGHTLAVFAAERKIQHSLSDLELLGLTTPGLTNALYDRIAGTNIRRAERFLGRLGYQNSEEAGADGLVPVMGSGQHITGVCFDKGYDTLALGSDEAVATMYADNIPMSERKVNMLPGLVIVSGSDVETDSTGKKPYDPLLVLPPLPVTTWRTIKHISPPTTPLIDPANAKRAEQWARLYYRSGLLSRIAEVRRFLSDYRTGPSDTSSNARDRTEAIDGLAGDVAEVLLRPSLNTRHYVHELGVRSMAYTGVITYAYDQPLASVA